MRPREWPCPNAGDIVPCTCFSDELLNIYLDCQGLGSIAELTNIFTVDFPFKKFARLQVSHNVLSDGILDGSVFGTDFVFREVIFFDNGLKDVSSDAFMQSASELTFIDFVEPEANNFPLPVDLTPLGNLREVVLEVACESTAQTPYALPSWISDTLVILTVSCSVGPTALPDNAFTLSSLEALHIINSNLIQIGVGNFAASTELVSVSFQGNSLENIDGVLEFSSINGVQLLDLSMNQLKTMPQITGMASGSTVRISDNTEIVSLPEETTKPLIEDEITIEANNIELTCNCEFRWLLGDDDINMPLAMNIIGETDNCENTEGGYDGVREIFDTLCNK
ncbi:hypothetical protein Pcinc_019615 [Petrolisthes cinctipes]|uniref:Oplophorus-luciferin 2-monooxygenase non-catalytic subunit n=1 Tax=Petrolisthes cinctipes TaxID=88211 RepID=A0AAE1FJR4_PETCI|nr:hypothetical protein Pcinc_019615 [Petrolisthes cinctipes]